MRSDALTWTEELKGDKVGVDGQGWKEDEEVDENGIGLGGEVGADRRHSEGSAISLTQVEATICIQ